jgi:hypothetical protein
MGLRKHIENLTVDRLEEDGFRRGAGVIDSENSSNVRVFNADLQTITDGTVIFSGQSVDILGGHVVGTPIDAIDYTFSDGTFESIRTAQSRGRDSGGDRITVSSVLPAKNIKKFGFTTGTSADNVYGFEIMVVDV